MHHLIQDNEGSLVLPPSVPGLRLLQLLNPTELFLAALSSRPGKLEVQGLGSSSLSGCAASPGRSSRFLQKVWQLWSIPRCLGAAFWLGTGPSARVRRPPSPAEI